MLKKNFDIIHKKLSVYKINSFIFTQLLFNIVIRNDL